jgi:bifunctional oligoribonuclease and PAP phosphatase NrnA
MKAMLKKLSRHERFLITAHVNPDPDALCSALAMREFLRGLGKKAAIVFDEPLNERLRIFPGVKSVAALHQRKSWSFEAMIVLDCGDRSRIGRVQELLTPEKEVFNIDHHVTNTLFGDVNLVNPQSSSTAEMLYELFAVAGCELTKTMASNLYAGLMTDTGCFRYDNTTARTHEIAAELFRFDIKAPDIYQRIYETVALADARLFAGVINSIDVLYDGQVVVVELSQQILKGFSEAFDVRDAVFNYLRPIKGVKLIVILTEVSANETRVNFRSSGRVDVARLAGYFDGGGHKNASGCRLSQPMTSARKLVLEEVGRRL